MSESPLSTKRNEDNLDAKNINQDGSEKIEEQTKTPNLEMQTGRFNVYGVNLPKTDKDYSHLADSNTITIESESVHSSDTELSNYITCCSECDRSDDLGHVVDDRNAHDRNNNKNSRRTTSTSERSTGGSESCGSIGGNCETKNSCEGERKLYEAMNYQIKTNPSFTKKFEGEEMRIKITETKENVKAITTIHLVHTPDSDQNGTQEFEGNVSRKKRLFMPNKRPSDNKYRKLFYELPETSTETQYAEEEFVYEPRFRTTTTKLVMKTRSLINLNDADTEATGMMPERSEEGFKESLHRHKSENDLNSLRESRSESRQSEHTNEDSHFINIKKQLESAIFQKDKHNSNITNIDVHSGSDVRRLGKGKSPEVCRDSQTLPKTIEKDQGSQDRQCRITGATFKSPSEVQNENYLWSTCPRRDRFCFYYPKKRNREIIDDELPDPDKVKDIRDRFEHTIKTGSTENITPTITSPKKITNNRPNKFQFNTWSPAYHTYPTVEITETTINSKKENGHAKLTESPKFKYWSDTTSVSSGVASDFSCETDSESSPRLETQDLFQMSNDTNSSGQPVSVETLKKIRACGTSTTYYGGRMISCDRGMVRSPMTMTIMDEIRQNIKENDVNLQIGIKSLQNKYSGMKFRLVKSNSCGSRLELTGTTSSDRSRRQTLQSQGKSNKLERVNENESSCWTDASRENKCNSKADIFSNEPEVTRTDLNFLNDSNQPCFEKNSRNACDFQIDEEVSADFPRNKFNGARDNVDYNSICLVENDTEDFVQTDFKAPSDFVRPIGQSTKEIVKVFEAAQNQKEEASSTPWKTLIESRKQANRTIGIKRVPVFEEMEFEEFEILDESSANRIPDGSQIMIEQRT